MTTETKPTQAHIQFTPLILPRKTPAEELREIVRRISIAPNYETRESLEALAARLEAPDEPKGWDGVWPWVRKNTADQGCVVLFSDSLCFYESSLNVWSSGTREEAENGTPYHDGVIITITAGDGTEDVKVLRGTADDRWLYLALGEHSVVLTDPYGDAVGEAKDRWPKHCEPLPPGTVTRIVINNTLPTTEQRYSVEVIEPEKPKFEPISLLHGDTVVSVQDATVVNYQHYRRSVMTPLEARQAAAALAAAANHLDPQEQHATAAVAVGLPLEFRCADRATEVHIDDSIQFGGGLFFEVTDHRGSSAAHAPPSFEARLRNLLNQRHADGKGGGA